MGDEAPKVTRYWKFYFGTGGDRKAVLKQDEGWKERNEYLTEADWKWAYFVLQKNLRGFSSSHKTAFIRAEPGGHSREYLICRDVTHSEVGDERQPLVPAGFQRAQVQRENLAKFFNLCSRCLPEWTDTAFQIYHHYEIETAQRKGCVLLQVTQQAKLHRHIAGEYGYVLQLPKFPESPFDLPAKAICVPTRVDELWPTLEQVDRLLFSSSGKAILLTGPPGSGKDVFYNILHHGSLRSHKRTCAVAVAGVPYEEIRRLLLGEKVGDYTRLGFLEDVKGGTLFLDEFDKPHMGDGSLYALLLRILESDNYYPVNAAKQEKAEDVSWVFGGAFTGKHARVPPDLWSRIGGHIELVNLVKTKDYAARLFLYWFLRQVVRRFLRDRKEPLKALLNEKLSSAADARCLLFGKPEPICQNCTITPGLLAKRISAEIEKLKKIVGSRPCYRPSVHTVRAILKASEAASEVCINQMIGAGQKEWRELCKDKARIGDVVSKAREAADRSLKIAAKAMEASQ